MKEKEELAYLKEMINAERKILDCLLTQGTKKEEILRQSQKLDVLINKYYEMLNSF